MKKQKKPANHPLPKFISNLQYFSCMQVYLHVNETKICNNAYYHFAIRYIFQIG